MRADTRYYWALTRHIYRYNHHNSGNGTSLSNGVHTVNECELILWLSEGEKWKLTLSMCSSGGGRVPRADQVLHHTHLER